MLYCACRLVTCVSVKLFAALLKVVVPKAVRQTVSKLTECGFLFNKVRKYVDAHGTDHAIGLVGQVSAVRLLLECLCCEAAKMSMKTDGPTLHFRVMTHCISGFIACSKKSLKMLIFTKKYFSWPLEVLETG